MENEPISPWPLKESTSSRLLGMSNAYAEAAAVLSQALIDDDFTADFMNTRVVLHLCRHSMELFLKGALEAKTAQKAPNTHRLDRLYKAYRLHYPADRHQFETPFGREVFDADGGLFPETLAPLQAVHDQRYRYPTDGTGATFVDAEPFDAAKYASAIADFRFEINMRTTAIDMNFGDDFWGPFSRRGSVY